MLIVYLLLILMILLWSFSFIVVDVAVDYIPPLSIALYRFIISSMAFIIIDIYMKFKGEKESDDSNSLKKMKFSKKEINYLILASFTGGSIFFLAQYIAIKLIGPSLPALFVCLLAPIVITSLSLIFFDEKLDKLKIIGFIIASIGAFLLITAGNISTLTPESPIFIGYIFALMTPLLWGIFSTLLKNLSKSRGNCDLKILKYISYLCCIELFFFVLINGEFSIFLANFFNIVILLCAFYLGIGCYIVGYFIWQKSQREMKSSKVASFLYIEPFITLIFSFILQRSETIVLWNIIGGIIVLIALLIINYK